MVPPVSLGSANDTTPSGPILTMHQVVSASPSRSSSRRTPTSLSSPSTMSATPPVSPPTSRTSTPTLLSRASSRRREYLFHLAKSRQPHPRVVTAAGRRSVFFRTAQGHVTLMAIPIPYPVTRVCGQMCWQRECRDSCKQLYLPMRNRRHRMCLRSQNAVSLKQASCLAWDRRADTTSYESCLHVTRSHTPMCGPLGPMPAACCPKV